MKIHKDLRYDLVPQMKTYDQIGHKFLPYIMFTQKPNFRSNVLNTDDTGFRYNFDPQKKVFSRKQERRVNFVSWGSTGFGVGSSKDQNTVTGYLEKNIIIIFLIFREELLLVFKK